MDLLAKTSVLQLSGRRGVKETMDTRHSKRCWKSNWTKVCSLHFNESDLNANAIPSKFVRKESSPRKQPPPTERTYQE